MASFDNTFFTQRFSSTNALLAYTHKWILPGKRSPRGVCSRHAEGDPRQSLDEAIARSLQQAISWIIEHTVASFASDLMCVPVWATVAGSVGIKTYRYEQFQQFSMLVLSRIRFSRLDFADISRRVSHKRYRYEHQVRINSTNDEGPATYGYEYESTRIATMYALTWPYQRSKLKLDGRDGRRYPVRHDTRRFFTTGTRIRLVTRRCSSWTATTASTTEGGPALERSERWRLGATKHQTCEPLLALSHQIATRSPSAS
eukprot:scaffold21309_cov46-Prasinocladus_malaysianus.AAC.1